MSRTPPAAAGQASRSPSARCWAAVRAVGLCRDHPCSNEEHPSTGTWAFCREETSLGQSVFNPRVSPQLPELGKASPQRQGPRQSCPAWFRAHCPGKGTQHRFPALCSRGRSGPAAPALPQHEQRTNKFALCLGQSRQLLESMSDRISAVADSLSLHIFMSVKKREARGS